MPSETIRRYAVCVVGYALTLIFFGLFTGRANALFYGENAQAVFSLYAHAAEIGQFGCLFVVGLAAARFPHAIERSIPAAAAALLVCGYALTLYQAVGGGAALWMSALAGALFGAGQGASFLGWFQVYCRMPFERAAACMVASTLLSGALLLSIGALSSAIALFSVLSIVIALNCALLLACLRNSRAQDVRDATGGTVQMVQPAPSTPPNDGGVSAWMRSWAILERRSLLCLLAVAFVCGAQRVVSLEGFLPQGSAALLFAFGYAAGALVFWATLRMGGDEGGYFRVYTVLLLTMATCGVFSFVPNTTVQTLLYAVDNVAFTIVSMCMVMMAVGVSREAPFSALVLGGVVCGVMYFAIQMGRIVCNAVERVAGMDIVGALVVSVIIIYVIALAAVSSGAFLRQVGAPGIAGASVAEDGARDAVDVDDKVKSDGAAASSGSDRPVGRGPSGSGSMVISISQVTEAQLRANPVYRETFGFTDREIDAMVLLLAGYNASDIAVMLHISVNTVKTHLKSLYSKAGVHNRRDLIALLNEIERPDRPAGGNAPCAGCPGNVH